MNNEVPAWLVFCFIAASVTVAAVAVYRSQEVGRSVRMLLYESEGIAPRSNSDDLLRTFPGITQPPALSPSDIPWKGEDEVVGVSLNGQSRAYLVDALSQPYHHVINDMIGQTPVSITYCNISHCARAFTRDGARGPLDIAVGGQHNLEGLLLLVDGARFHQADLRPYEPGHGPATFPYQPLPLTVTTWRKWKELHPDSMASLPRPPTSMQPHGAGTAPPHSDAR
jgi:hypothetical protein